MTENPGKSTLRGVRERGGSIVIVCTRPQIRRIFQITGLGQVFGLFETIEDAHKELVQRSAADGA